MICCIYIDWSAIDWNAWTAIGTIFLAVITLVTVLQNKSQLKELKRQWEIEQSPDLDIVLINLPYRDPKESLAIEISNFGKGAADNIKIIFDDDFKNNFPHKAVRDQIEKIENNAYRILPGKNKIIPVCQFDNNLAKCRSLFGMSVNEKERIEIHHYIEKFVLHLRCNYNGTNSPFELTFTSEDKEWKQNTLSSSIGGITEELENVRECLESISSKLGIISDFVESRN